MKEFEIWLEGKVKKDLAYKYMNRQDLIDQFEREIDIIFETVDLEDSKQKEDKTYEIWALVLFVAYIILSPKYTPFEIIELIWKGNIVSGIFITLITIYIPILFFKYLFLLFDKKSLRKRQDESLSNNLKPSEKKAPAKKKEVEENNQSSSKNKTNNFPELDNLFLEKIETLLSARAYSMDWILDVANSHSDAVEQVIYYFCECIEDFDCLIAVENKRKNEVNANTSNKDLVSMRLDCIYAASKIIVRKLELIVNYDKIFRGLQDDLKEQLKRQYEKTTLIPSTNESSTDLGRLPSHDDIECLVSFVKEKEYKELSKIKKILGIEEHMNRRQTQLHLSKLYRQWNSLRSSKEIFKSHVAKKMVTAIAIYRARYMNSSH